MKKSRKGRRISTLGSRFTSMVSVTFVLVLLGTAAMAWVAGKSLTTTLRENMGFVIKMERGCPPGNIASLKQYLLATEGVKQITFTSADDVFAQEREFLGDDVALLGDANPYNAEFDVKVAAAYAGADSIEALAAHFGSIAGVEEIVLENAVVDDINRTLERVELVALCFAVLLLVISFVLISNAISLSIYSKRFLIHTMKLVGATAAYIRRPFLVSAATAGASAGIAASAVVIALRCYAAKYDASLASLLPWGATAAVCVALVVEGAAICLTAAIFSTRRYLRASYDDMFLK